MDLALVAGFVGLVLPALVFSNQTLSTSEFWTDLFKLTQPSFTYTGEQLAAGHLPLWNPYWFSGYPHLAMPSACVFYPTTILFGILSFPVALKIVSLLHVYLAGAFGYALGRSTFGRRVPALYLAFVIVAGDLVLSPLRLSQLWALQTMSWFPLAVLFTDRIVRGGRWGSAFGLALTLAMMIFGGDPQSFAFCMYFIAFYALSASLFRIVSSESKSTPIMSLVFFILALMFGVGIAGIQIIPSRELYAESVRSHGVSFVQLAFGPPGGFLKSFAWLDQEDLLWIMSASRTIIVLAAGGLFFARDTRVFAALLAGLLCLLYAVMPKWFYDAVVQYIPIYNGVRGAVRMSIIVWWVVAFLSAFGIAVWTRPSEESETRQRRIALVSLGLLIGLTLLPPLMGGSMPAGRLIPCAVAAAGVLVSLAYGRVPMAGTIAAALLIVSGAGELVWKAHRVGFSGDPALLAVNDDFAKFSASRGDIDRMGVVYDQRMLRQGNAVGMLTRDRLFQGYHGLMLSRYARILDEFGGLTLAPRDASGNLLDTLELQSDWVTPRMLPVLDLFNVRYLVKVERQGVFSGLDLSQARRFRQIKNGSFAVYENLSVLPPVYPVHDVIACETDDRAIALLRDGRVDVRKQVTVTGAFDTTGLSAPTAGEPVTIREYSPERIRVDANLSTPGVVVFSEMFYPGWRAYVDGVEREVLCVDTAFRGVRVEAGQRTVEMRFVPMSLRIGAFVSGVSLISAFVISILVLLRSQRRIRRRDDPITPA